MTRIRQPYSKWAARPGGMKRVWESPRSTTAWAMMPNMCPTEVACSRSSSALANRASRSTPWKAGIIIVFGDVLFHHPQHQAPARPVRVLEPLGVDERGGGQDGKHQRQDAGSRTRPAAERMVMESPPLGCWPDDSSRGPARQLKKGRLKPRGGGACGTRAGGPSSWRSARRGPAAGPWPARRFPPGRPSGSRCCRWGYSPSRRPRP